ncbi:hypothetical protein EV200_106333 [Pedobacter psychrotolerans]|uniref:Uncharacterized protein n=1 Tax=Pedobacter psychrotolerans TaxID=1843235 RepID=A0A4R2H8S8_9SPHI|nr:hypothetical protein [Pedobacter psychrotolerans]TCO22688.1 hypothetical protein EV200_106333 [Pedobacter psychrotolerans]
MKLKFRPDSSPERMGNNCIDLNSYHLKLETHCQFNEHITMKPSVKAFSGSDFPDNIYMVPRESSIFAM